MPEESHPLDDGHEEIVALNQNDNDSTRSRLFRFSLSEILIAVFVLSFSFATLASGSIFLSSIGQVAYSFLTGIAIIGVIILRGERQSFWIGVAVFCLMPYVWRFIHGGSLIPMDSGFSGIVFYLNPNRNSDTYLSTGLTNFIWGSVSLFGGKIAKQMFLAKQEEL